MYLILTAIVKPPKKINLNITYISRTRLFISSKFIQIDYKLLLYKYECYYKLFLILSHPGYVHKDNLHSSIPATSYTRTFL